MRYLTSEYQKIVNARLNSRAIYELAFVLYFIIAFFQTTTYTIYFPGNFLHRLAFIPLLLVLFKIIFFDSNSVTKLAVNLIILSLLVITWRTSGEFILFPLGIFILGARDVDFRRIIYFYLILGTILLSFVFFSSLVGLTKNLIFHRDNIQTIRQAFGIIYPTDFAAHVLYLALAYCYLNFKKLSWRSYAVFIILAYLLIRYCDARLSAYSLILVIPVMMIGQRAQKGYKVSKSIAIFYWTLPILAAYLTALLSYLYTPHNAILEKLNSVLSGRLYYNWLAFKRYGVLLFGQHVHENGLGAVDGIKNLSVNSANYFYIDSAFIRLLVIYGAVIAVLMIIAMTVIAWRSIRKANFALASVIVIITISAVVEQRLLDFGYDPFILATFATCYGIRHYDLREKHNEKFDIK